MSGYEKSTPSKLGGGIPGKFEVAFGNTMKGGDVALNRRKLRKAFKTNKVTKPTGGKLSSTCGPFRSAYQLGDPLNRQYMSCGGCNQVNSVNSNVLKTGHSDSVSSKDCNVSVHGITPLDVPLSNSNHKFVSDSSRYTEFKKLGSINLTYNDKTGGGSGKWPFL